MGEAKRRRAAGTIMSEAEQRGRWVIEKELIKRYPQITRAQLRQVTERVRHEVNAKALAKSLQPAVDPSCDDLFVK